jgi:cellulose biosynthesis protein BcsQ
MKHYSLHNVNDNLTVFFLNSTLDQDDSWLDKQIDSWKANYDYLLIEFPWLQNNLCNIALNKTNKFINVFDAQNFTSDTLVKTITSFTKFKNINKNWKCDFFILNRYINQSSNSLTALAQINKVFLKSIFVKTLPFDDNLLAQKDNQWNYAIKEFWTKYAIELNEIVKLL